MNEKINPQDLLSALNVQIIKSNAVLNNPNATAVQYAEALGDLVDAAEILGDWFSTQERWQDVAWEEFDRLGPANPDDKETSF